MIKQNQDNPKKLWGTLDSLLGRSIPKSLPSTDSPSDLASSFLKFFDDKITKLCSYIPFNVNSNSTSVPSSVPTPPILSSFEPASSEEIRKLILSSTDASCSLDFIPTRLLKSCIDALVTPITHLINLSLSEGVFPTSFKHAVVSPLLKKQSLPKDDFSSYRPISNLNFISKILEKVIYARLCHHLESFPSLSNFQSAYRKLHSTETALLQIHNDLSLAMNRQQVSALVLLDLSAAFDTIDHNILTNRLKTLVFLNPLFPYFLPIFHVAHNQSLLDKIVPLHRRFFVVYPKVLFLVLYFFLFTPHLLVTYLRMHP